MRGLVTTPPRTPSPPRFVWSRRVSAKRARARRSPRGSPFRTSRRYPPRASPPKTHRAPRFLSRFPRTASPRRSRGLFACFFFRSRPSVSDVLRLLLRKAPAELAQALEPELALLADEPPGRRGGERRLLAPCGVFQVAQSLGPHAWPTRLALLEGRARSLRVRQRRGAGEVGGTTHARVRRARCGRDRGLLLHRILHVGRRASRRGVRDAHLEPVEVIRERAVLLTAVVLYRL